MYRISSQLYPSDLMAADLSFLVRWFVIQNASIITWQTSHPDHTFPMLLLAAIRSEGYKWEEIRYMPRP